VDLPHHAPAQRGADMIQDLDERVGDGSRHLVRPSIALGDPQRPREAFRDVLDTSVRYKTDMRTAAYIVAINRVAQVTKLRGMYA